MTPGQERAGAGSRTGGGEGMKLHNLLRVCLFAFLALIVLSEALQGVSWVALTFFAVGVMVGCGMEALVTDIKQRKGRGAEDSHDKER